MAVVGSKLWPFASQESMSSGLITKLAAIRWTGCAFTKGLARAKPLVCQDVCLGGLSNFHRK